MKINMALSAEIAIAGSESKVKTWREASIDTGRFLILPSTLPSALLDKATFDISQIARQQIIARRRRATSSIVLRSFVQEEKEAHKLMAELRQLSIRQ